MSKRKEREELPRNEENSVNPSNIKEEKREFTRCKICLCAEVKLSTGVVIEGKTEDISLNGLLFKTERGLPIDTEVKIRLLLYTNEKTNDSLSLKGKVVRIDEKGVAIKFNEMESDTFEHLKRLLIYNMDKEGDINNFHNEVDNHIGIKRKIS